MCDNTTKFSKWIKKKKPHLKDKILQCAAHLTGIAWQKRSHTKAKIRRAEDQLLKAAIDESLQKPVDPRKLASSKVHTATIPLLAQPLTASTAVAWPSTSSPPPGARLVLSASVQAQRPPPHLGSDVHIPARGMCCMLLQCMSVNS
jgi:hypothetical protein